jgi:spore germination protein GerM
VAPTAAVLVGLTGCGVTVQAHPHELATATAPHATSLVGPVTRLTDVYLVRGEKVIASHRAVPDPVTLQRTVQALLNGPTREEAGHGLRSAVPGSLRLRRVELSGSTAVVDVTSGLSSVSSQEQALALAQLVYTVTARSGVDSLRVLVDGQRVEVARADGALTGGDVTRGDYQALLAP